MIVIGAGAAGSIAAITAAQDGKKVLVLEKLPQIGSKLKASGGGKCNLTNTLSNEDFMAKFGRSGRFMQDALNIFDSKALIGFFKDIGVETHAPDGFRIFPTSHNSQSIVSALLDRMKDLKVEILTSKKAEKLLHSNHKIEGVCTAEEIFYAPNVILATGGLGYPTLGSEGDGHKIAKELGHNVTDLYPAMMPLQTKEKWVANCRADTIAKVELRIDIKKHSRIRANGDLIFTKDGIRGPVILDIAREITPLLEIYGEVPILLNLTKRMNEEQITKHFKDLFAKNTHLTMLELVNTLLPKDLSNELCILAEIDPKTTYKKISGSSRAKLIALLAWIPLTVIGHDGFKAAMITRGGIDLKEIEPKTMQSKRIEGLYFCGEITDLDGPCGGYNLQWSFASGYLAGKLSKNI